MKKPENRNLCSICNNKPVIFARSYSGERLCKKCFINSIEAKVKKTISKYNMFKYNDKIAIAVSGGKDSINLLHILSKTQKNQPKSEVIAIIIDEGIEKYRDEALAIAISNCKYLKIDYKIVTFKELYGYTLDEIIKNRKKKEKLSSCAFCGVLRRKAINYAARLVNANKIATAHTLDDEVQTILLNIFHGDLNRLAKGKPASEIAHPCFIQKVKPFCEILEKESALYAYLKKVEFQATPCPYSSEALRNDVRLMINYIEKKHSGTKFSIFQTIEKIRPALNKLEKKSNFRECDNCGEPASFSLCKACEVLKRIN